MRDVNFALRKAYFSALSGITYNGVAVPVYYKNAPNETNTNYIIFGGIANNDASTLNSNDTLTSIRVSIYTYKEKYNDGKAADDLAGEVLGRIYPSPGFTLDLSADNLQMVSTELSGDNTNEWTLQDQKEYVDRFITFRHRIFHL